MCPEPVAYPGFFSGGVQQIQLRTEGRQNGDLGAVAPSEGFNSICKWAKLVFWLGCYRCIFHEIWPSFLKTSEFRGGGFEPPKHPPGYASGQAQQYILQLYNCHIMLVFLWHVSTHFPSHPQALHNLRSITVKYFCAWLYFSPILYMHVILTEAQRDTSLCIFNQFI
jgi:hypothetical protein